MTRKLIAHEREFIEIVRVFERDDELYYLSPDTEFPAEPNEITITEDEFIHAQNMLKAPNIQQARASGPQVTFFEHSNLLGSMAYGYHYVNSSKSKRSPALPDLTYKRISKLRYGTYYKHVKGNWYLYVEYREW